MRIARGLSRGISEWEKSESPFRQRSFLPKEFSKKSSRQTVTRGKGSFLEGDLGWERGCKGRTRVRQETRGHDAAVGCNAKEKLSALGEPTCGTLSPELYHRKRSPKLRSIDARVNYERLERRTFVIDNWSIMELRINFWIVIILKWQLYRSQLLCFHCREIDICGQSI